MIRDLDRLHGVSHGPRPHPGLDVRPQKGTGILAEKGPFQVPGGTTLDQTIPNQTPSILDGGFALGFLGAFALKRREMDGQVFGGQIEFPTAHDADIMARDSRTVVFEDLDSNITGPNDHGSLIIEKTAHKREICC